MAHIRIATPSYDAKVTTAYAHTLVRTVVNCALHDIVVSVDFKNGCPYLSYSRNWLTHRFLASNADAILFIDSDVGWNHKAVAKLYQSGLDFVGGVPPLKSPNEGYPVELLDGRQTIGTDQYREALYLPTGFLLIRRSVFEKLAGIGLASSPYLDLDGQRVNGFFSEMHYPDGFCGEDTQLCNLWRKVGGQVWCLPDLDFEHQGTKIWTGNYETFLNSSPQQSARIAAD